MRTNILLRDKLIVAVIVANALVLSGFQFFRKQLREAPVQKLVPIEVVVGNKGDFAGDPQAPFTLVEFGDYQCPPCGHAFPSVENLLRKHPRSLRFQFRHLPLTEIHPLALHASEVAEAARDKHEFWQVHKFLYSNQAKLSDSFLDGISGKASQSSEKRIDEDVADADKLSIRSTPSFLLCTPDNKVWVLKNVDQVNRFLD